MRRLSLWFEEKDEDEYLSVRSFSVTEAMSGPFEVYAIAMSRESSIDLEAIVGKPAAFTLQGGVLFRGIDQQRRWRGICSYIEQVRVEVSDSGLSTYALTIVPGLWLLGQRRDQRIFQNRSIPDIVDVILDRWKIERRWKVDRGAYPKLEYRVQYGETDLAFLTRMLEEAGIAYTFPDQDGASAVLELGDRFEAAEAYGTPLVFADSPSRDDEKEYVTGVQIGRGVRPGAYILRDHDFRRPDFELQGEAPRAKTPEDRYEQYRYEDGALLRVVDQGGDTPVADGKSVARRQQSYGVERATRRLDAERHEKQAVSFETNSMMLAPGTVFSIARHPHQDLAGRRLLVTELRVQGTATDEPQMFGRAVFTDRPYRPPHVTPKPKATGIESAFVVGPSGEEIHADEFGRVRVQFPWDREGKKDDDSSCWMRVSQGWAGAGFGAIALPRVGQEVLVSFLGGDPDQPIVVGRVFNAKNVVPYKLPEHKTRSSWKSQSSPGGGGSNEITFDDAKGQELVYMQAEKDLRKLVKSDETEVTRGHHQLLIASGQEIVVKAEKRELIEGDSHLHVTNDQRRKVEGKESIIVGGSRHETIGESHALEAGKEIHLKGGTTVVIEAMNLTLKDLSGNFIHIGPGGVDIVGTMVNINSGGSAGSGSGARPDAPDEAAEAKVEPPSA
ncbi:type VI secretion system Vgr family protein [Sorangium sp. So ce131]|uniref:type VI secretion system Vgr family protein n=1 Tax=Sorangium sp. So ce131 TaxID=3133282 RepID=UPI003F612B4F